MATRGDPEVNTLETQEMAAHPGDPIDTSLLLQDKFFRGKRPSCPQKPGEQEEDHFWHHRGTHVALPSAGPGAPHTRQSSAAGLRLLCAQTEGGSGSKGLRHGTHRRRLGVKCGTSL